jgi:sterol desaturase/sphingolipid hydroxylase (fatty acid hydroxylase superfamily)
VGSLTESHSLFQFDETTIRGIVFLVIFFCMMIWEMAAPRRKLTVKKSNRWFTNLAIIIINNVLVRAAVPLMPAALAALARNRQWGILIYFNMPPWLEIVVAVILLDLAIYLQHVMFHTLPLLWRLHLVHHADLDIDVTTGLRFHPIEIVISMFIKLFAVLLLGPDPLAVIIFEAVLNGSSMFNHANIRMPAGVDRILRYFIVTPDMHRVHHSVNIRETNSNFGFNAPWWDRLFGTYRDRPAAGHESMAIGLAQYRKPARYNLIWVLALPFTADPGGYAINRRGRDPENRE